MDSSKNAKISGVVVDCQDPEALAAFWSALLGTDKTMPLGEPVHYVLIGQDGSPYLSFQRVPESKAVKNRLHLDLHVEDLEAATAVVERLGGSRGIDVAEYGYSWRTMTDPEGNEFCLVPS
jgi:predicted enzyme related to lactoylglutathione lyase